MSRTPERGREAAALGFERVAVPARAAVEELPVEPLRDVGALFAPLGKRGPADPGSKP